MEVQRAPCPECGELISLEAKSCRFCKAILSDKDRLEMVRRVVNEKEEEEKATRPKTAMPNTRASTGTPNIRPTTGTPNTAARTGQHTATKSGQQTGVGARRGTRARHSDPVQSGMGMIAMVVGALLAVGVGYYFYTHYQNSTADVDAEQRAIEEKNKETNEKNKATLAEAEELHRKKLAADVARDEAIKKQLEQTGTAVAAAFVFHMQTGEQIPARAFEYGTGPDEDKYQVLLMNGDKKLIEKALVRTVQRVDPKLPPKVESPSKVETPKGEAPKVDPTRVVPPSEAPKVDPTRVVPTSAEAPKADSAKLEPPKAPPPSK